MTISWMQAIGGFGLFLLSLRFLSSILENSISEVIRDFLKKALAHRSQCVFFGFVATALVQASSITIVTSLGLLNTSLITLEQGFLVMLGATLGTTVKSWFFAFSIHKYGTVIIGACSILLILVRRPLFREIIQVILFIGLVFLALNMMSQGLKPLIEEQSIQTLLRTPKEYAFSTQIWSIIIGCAITMAIQSSSTIVFLVLDMAGQGILPFETGAFIILGANIGTTVTPFIASLEYGRHVKRLAIAHILIKVCGVFVTLLMFPTFLLVIDTIVPGSFEENLIFHLAATHTVFNFFNVIFWYFLSSLMMRFLFSVMPSQIYDEESQSSLSLRVRKMLARHPSQACKEIDNQMSRLEDMTKAIVDYNLSLLIDGKSKKKPPNALLMQRRFKSFKEVIYDLLTRLKPHPLSEEKDRYIFHQLRLLNDFTNFYDINIRFKGHIEKGMIINSYKMQSEIRNLFQEFQKGFNEIWLKIVLNNLATQFGANLKNIIQDLENVYYFYLSKTEGLSKNELYWLYETNYFLRQMVISFFSLYEGTQKFNKESLLLKTSDEKIT